MQFRYRKSPDADDVNCFQNRAVWRPRQRFKRTGANFRKLLESQWEFMFMVRLRRTIVMTERKKKKKSFANSLMRWKSIYTVRSAKKTSHDLMCSWISFVLYKLGKNSNFLGLHFGEEKKSSNLFHWPVHILFNFRKLANDSFSSNRHLNHTVFGQIYIRIEKKVDIFVLYQLLDVLRLLINYFFPDLYERID